MEINWKTLHLAAKEVMTKAYAPYSNFKVGVAGLVSDGRIIVGCNSENASYGVGLCAECGLISSLTATGGGRLIAVVCVDVMVSIYHHVGVVANCYLNMVVMRCYL